MTPGDYIFAVAMTIVIVWLVAEVSGRDAFKLYNRSLPNSAAGSKNGRWPWINLLKQAEETSQIVTGLMGGPSFWSRIADRPLAAPSGRLPWSDRALVKIVASLHCRFDNSADAVWGTERHGLWTKAKPLAPLANGFAVSELPYSAANPKNWPK
jgi:hypothetical protein